MKTTAKIISILFHPAILPTIGLLIIFNTNSYINYTIAPELKQALLLLVLMNTMIIPIFLSLVLILTKKIDNLEMETQKERYYPYIFTIIFYLFTLFRLYEEPISPIIFNFMIGATISVILAFIVNFKWKISAHMIGIGGLIGALISIALLLGVYIIPMLLASIFVAGLLGTSRLILKAHTPAQIYIGFILGVLCQITSMYF